MPAKVRLIAIKGKLTGKEFVFDERTTCILGRAKDCYPQVPNDQDHQTVSRYHCLLDINPPGISVRDFGSLNGTFVNGRKIGQREKDQPHDRGFQEVFHICDLKDGDEIKLGNTAFQVSISVPTLCAECSVEIPAEQRAQAMRTPGIYQCLACRHKAARVTRTELLRRNSKICAKCGKDVSGEMGEHRQGEFLCAACKTDPSYLVRFLMELADKGDKNLLAIQGYEIIRELGKGGMGAVYLACQMRTGNQVALKVMLPEAAADEYAKESFWREAENTRALKHRHTVELRDWGISNGIFFFTLEYCEGGSVSDLIKRRGGKLSIDEAGRIILQALDGLEYAHHAPIPYVKRFDGSFGPGRGLVHRDIKPANIFLSGLGSSYIAKIGDYGLAKAFDVAGLSGQTGTNAKAGTLQFMPRQQAVSFKYAKPEVDVWAMAATFYMMLTGRCPRDFPKREDPQGMDVWQVVLQTKPVPIRNRDASIPKRLADVIDLALVDQPAIHFKTAAEFKQALEGVL